MPDAARHGPFMPHPALIALAEFRATLPAALRWTGGGGPPRPHPHWLPLAVFPPPPPAALRWTGGRPRHGQRRNRHLRRGRRPTPPDPRHHRRVLGQPGRMVRFLRLFLHIALLRRRLLPLRR